MLVRWQGNKAQVWDLFVVLQNKRKKQVRTQPTPNLNTKWNKSWFRSAIPRNIHRSGGRFKKCGQTVWITHFHHSELGKRRRRKRRRKGNSFISPRLADRVLPKGNSRRKENRLQVTLGCQERDKLRFLPYIFYSAVQNHLQILWIFKLWSKQGESESSPLRNDSYAVAASNIQELKHSCRNYCSC